MNYRKIYVVLLLMQSIIILSAGQTTAAGNFNLEQCLSAGIENNPTLKAARLGIEAAEQDIKSARASFFPTLSSGYSVNMLDSQSAKGPTETDYLDQEIRTFNIKLSQILYAGSRIVNTYDRVKIRKQLFAVQMDLDQLKLVYDIKTTFYRLMKAEQDVIIAAESVKRLTESVKSASAFFQKQLIPYVDVLQAKVDLADADENLGIAENNVNRERTVLFSLMNMPDDPTMEFSGDLKSYDQTLPSFESSLEQALKNRPEIKRLGYEAKIIQKNADIALGKYLPLVRLDVGYYDQNRDYDQQGNVSGIPYDRDQRNRYWSAGVSANWDLFDGGRAWFEKEKYRIEEQKISALINEARNMIATGIRKALYSMAEAKQRFTASVEALTAAREYYAREEKRLGAGLSTIPDLLDAQDRLIRAQGNQIRAIFDFWLAESELQFMIGKKNNPHGPQAHNEQ